jgi:hypothetical protein
MQSDLKRPFNNCQKKNLISMFFLQRLLRKAISIHRKLTEESLEQVLRLYSHK